MTLIRTKGARFGLAVLGAAAWLTPAAAIAAQPAYGGAQTPLPSDPLSTNLRILAESPHNVGALIGAGKAALELGDAQGALTFFARAEQAAPRDGWVKKWEGSALVQLEQPAAALKFFRDAVSLGVPDASVAGDRGLAWDISGDPRRAQRDYRLALANSSDPEIIRRLALSLAISGERQQALQLLQDQIQRRDRAALRTRALVLALTGDWQSADQAVEGELPGPQAAALEPFLARLPSLSLAQRALAVHLGHFPGNGRAGAPAATYAANSYSGGAPVGYTTPPSSSASMAPPVGYTTPPSRSTSSPVGYAMSPGRHSPAVVRPAQRAETYASRDSDGYEAEPGFGSAVTPPAPARVAAASSNVPRPQVPAVKAAPTVTRTQAQRDEPRNPEWSWSRGELPPMPHRAPVKIASSEPALAQSESRTAARTEPLPPRPVEIAEAGTPITPPVTLAATPPPAAPRPKPAFTPASHAQASTSSRSRLADLAADLDRIEAERKGHKVASTAQRDEAPQSSSSRHVPAHKAPPAAAREPARHWVQLAHGESANLGGVFDKLKDKAPKLLAGRVAWVATGSPNRLVVGPFDSERAAQNFVDRLSDADLTAIAWTSETGQKVEKLSDQ